MSAFSAQTGEIYHTDCLIAVNGDNGLWIRMKRILVIEDNEPDLMMLHFAMSEAGASVTLDVIEDGGQARQRLTVDAAPAELPHLVLVDMNVPKADGLALVQHIRRCEWLRDVPVVIWSSTRFRHDLEAAQALRIDGFLVKPSDLAGWNDLVRQLLAVLNGGRCE